jgi:streptogrisin C
VKPKNFLRCSVALALTAAAGMTAMPSASAEAPGTTTKPRQASQESLISAMRRDLGLSRAQAEELMADQAEAVKDEEKLTGKLGRNYGGSWFDRASGKLVVGVTDKALASTVTSEGAQAVVVSRSEDQLEGIQDQLDADAVGSDRSALSAAASWSIDPVKNQVVVTLVKGRSSAKVKSMLGRFGSAVRYEEIATAPRTAAEYLFGGHQYSMGSGCSVGFNVTKGGRNYFLTAGHCGQVGTMTARNDLYIGPFAASWFPTYDVGVVENAYTDYWAQGPWVSAHTSDPYAVYTLSGYRDSPVGTVVCKSGYKTGLTCGYIRAKNESVQYEGTSGPVMNLTRHSACVEPGDSGGANISSSNGKNYAEGMTSGAQITSDKKCLSRASTPQENVSWYYPVAQSIGYFGVTLMTS